MIKGNYEKAAKVFNCKEIDGLEDEIQKLCRHYSWNIGPTKTFSKITKNSSRASSWSILGYLKLDNYDKRGAIKAFDKALKINIHQ